MKSSRMTDAEIRAQGWLALVERLGHAGALRFAIQTQQGAGDYPTWRQRTLGRYSVDELLVMMKSESAPRKRTRRK